MKGRYYFTPAPVRFADVFTPFGSRYWIRGDPYCKATIGEIASHPRPFNTGRPPLRVPLPVLLGERAALETGCTEPHQFGTADYLVDGFNPKCFPVPLAFVPNAAADMDPTNPAILLVLAGLIEWSYNNPQAAVDFFALWFGATVTVHIVPNSASLIPGSIIVVHPNWTIVAISGTSNPQQLAVQAAQSLRGPVNQGPFSTLPLWWTASNVIADRINAAGANTNAPIVFVGHSYGGVVATITAARSSLAFPTRQVSLVTFGMPAAGDERLCAQLRFVRSWHFSTAADPVPQLPLQGAYLYGLQALLPPGLINLWQQWCPPSPRLLMDGQQGYRPLPFQSLTTTVVRQIVLNLLANRPLGSFPQHEWGTYWFFLRQMVPGPLVWPLNEEVKAAVKSSPDATVVFQDWQAVWSTQHGVAMTIYPNAAFMELATQLRTYLDGNCEMGLYVNNIEITPLTILADLTEATFGGYARATGLAVDAPLLWAVQTTMTKVPAQTFTCDGSTGPETVYGAFLVLPSSDLGPVMILSTPKDMVVNGDSLTLSLAQFFGAQGAT